MVGAKKAVVKDEQLGSVYSNTFGTKVVFTTFRGFKKEDYEYPTFAASLYMKLEELIEDVLEEMRYNSSGKSVYVKAKSFINAASVDLFEAFTNYYLHKLAAANKSNIIMIAMDKVGDKLKKRFVAVAVKDPNSSSFVAVNTLFFGENVHQKQDPKALFKKTKKLAMEFLQKHWKEIGVRGEPKVVASVVVAVALEFPEDEIKVHVRDGHDTVKITIPLKKPSWSLEDFPEELVEELKTLVINPIREGLSFAPKGILLVGPPGVGKTILVEAISGGLEKRLLELEPGMYRSMWYGQTEKILREIFSAIKQRKDEVVVLIDDAEFLMDRGLAIHEGYISEMNMFLKMLQNKERPLVVMTTNHPQLLDQALVRPGRIDLAIIVGYPDKKFRRKIVERILKRYDIRAGDELIDKIVRVTKWFSNAEIDSLIRMAAAKGKGEIGEEEILWARRRFHVSETERERTQESLKWYANKLQGMVIRYVKDPAEV
ncbi:MAG: ATP-binding protein [Crenarchaeota archaeon]|nr:ATP-binding protein [Thermoproteota archaeon]